MTTLPLVAELAATRRAVARQLSERLEAASSHLLASPSGKGFPTQDRTILCALAFLVQHESFHLGQVALLRKGLGYGAMSYERRPGTVE